MNKNKKTTRELINDLIALETELELGLIPKDKKTEKQLITVKESLQKKMQDIDTFQFELKRTEKMLKAEMEAHSEEIEDLSKRIKKTLSIRLFFDGTLVPEIIRRAGKDGVYETTKSRYTLYETYGIVEVDEEYCPPKYKKAKIDHYIDRKEARIDAIEADKEGKTIPGVTIKKVERVRKT